jgi:hypothetical protein
MKTIIGMVIGAALALVSPDLFVSKAQACYENQQGYTCSDCYTSNGGYESCGMSGDVCVASGAMCW